MALKKQERKNKLCELYVLIRQIKNNLHAEQSKKIILEMLSHDGVYILDNDDDSHGQKPQIK